eukprot:gene17864-36523_t
MNAEAAATSRDLFDNPLGTDGFEFVEFTSPEPERLKGLFEKMGFTAVSRHRSKNVLRFRQGDINFILNMEPSGQAAAFREIHGPSANAMAFRVKDAAKALEPQLSDAQEKAALQKFTQAHAQMAQGYRKGFEVFQSLGFVPSAGDADVADIDQGPAKLLTELSQQVAASSAAIAQQAGQDARHALVSSLVALALNHLLGAANTGIASIGALSIGLPPFSRPDFSLEALRQSEARWRSLTALSSDWYWEQDDQFRFVRLDGNPYHSEGVPDEMHYGLTRWELPDTFVTEGQWRAHREQLQAHQ